MLKVLITLFHIIASLILIAVVLLQTGKRADLAGAFGGGGSQTAFGARGAATFLSKMTTAMAVVFMVTSLTLSILSSRATDATGAVLQEETAPAPQEQSAPAVPGGQPGASGQAAPTQVPADRPGTDDPAPADEDADN